MDHMRISGIEPSSVILRQQTNMLDFYVYKSLKKNLYQRNGV